VLAASYLAEGTVASFWKYRDLLEVPCLAECTVALLRRCRVFAECTVALLRRCRVSAEGTVALLRGCRVLLKVP
jgi:hypothetical protein